MKKNTRFYCCIAILFSLTACNLSGNKRKSEHVGAFLSSGLSGNNIWELKVHNNNLYAATDSGLYRIALNANHWQSISDGMHLTFIVFSEQEIMAEHKGILYRTANGGQTWQKYQNGFGGNTSFYPVDLELAQDNPDVIYAEVNGSSVAVSQNRGESWKLLWGTWDEAGAGFFIRVDPGNSKNIWAGGATPTTHPLLIRSINGGQSWQHINPANPIPQTSVYDLLINSDSSDIVLTSLGNGIYKSIDGGENWKHVFNKASIKALVQGQSNSQIVYAAGIDYTSRLSFSISHNFGDSWETVVDSTGPKEIYTNDLVVTTVNGKQILYFGTNKGVYSYELPE